jgi:crossover junction endodeoxyribonuclease RuvC
LIILGIDPSSTSTGYGLVEVTGSSHVFIACGCIRPKSNCSFEVRLGQIYDGICTVISESAPHEVAVESSYFGKDANAAVKLVEARGVIRLAAHQARLPVSDYSPAEVKKAVTGTGQATKEQVQFMITRMFGLREMPRPLDASDALAIALCHIHRRREQDTVADRTHRKPEVEALLARMVSR